MIAIGRGFLSREKELFLTQKLSWDDLIADHVVLTFKRRDLHKKLNLPSHFAQLRGRTV